MDSADAHGFVIREIRLIHVIFKFRLKLLTSYYILNLTLSHFGTNRYRLVEFINIVKKLNSLLVSLM